MIITCENCESKFRLDESLIKESGSKVRCSKCKHIFMAYRDTAAEEVSAEPGDEQKAPGDLEAWDEEAASPEGMDEPEGQSPEISEETPEEPLDFELFGSEEEDDEGFSLEDFGLDEDESQETIPAAEEISEEKITAEDLGFEEDLAPEEVPEPTLEKEGAQEIALEGVSPEEETVSDEGLPTAEQPSEEETAVEEDLSFEDLALEDQPAAEEAPQPSAQSSEEEAAFEEDLSFEDLALEDQPAAEEAPQPSAQSSEEEAAFEEDLSFEDLALEDELAADEPSQPTKASAPEKEVGEKISFQDLSPEDIAAEEELEEEEVSEEETAEPSIEAEAPLTEDLAVASWDAGEETEEEELQEEMPPPPLGAIPPPKRKGISTPLWVILIIVLVGGGAFAAYTLLTGSGIRIPFLKSVEGEAQSEFIDPGNRQITLLEDLITGEFVDSKSAGSLFVIKGKLKSNYAEARNFIKVKGVLYLKDGQIAKSRVVYCGNVLSDTDLQTVDAQAMHKRLANRFGDNKRNFNIPPGKVVPFMVVFFDVPEDLGEFSVEVVGSVPV